MHPSDDDYEEDDRPRRRKKDNSTAVVAALLAAILGMAGVGTLLAVVMVADARVEERKAKALPTRDEMRAKLAGKTMDQVREMLGKPDTTDDNDPDAPSWQYLHRTRDPESGEVDYDMRIYFRQRVVSRVHF